MKKILIIESSPSLLTLLTELLEHIYEIYIATTENKVFKVLESERPDLILLDTLLNDTDGYACLATVRMVHEYSQIPIILIASLTQSDNLKKKGFELGAVDYIYKPIDTEELKRRVNLHIELNTHKHALELIIQSRTRELEQTKKALLYSMAHLAETRDHPTGEHLSRIEHYTRLLASEVSRLFPESLPKEQIEIIAQSAVLHDIGKISTPDHILLKPSPLTIEETQIIQKHPLIGADSIRKTIMLLGENPLLSVAAEIAESHHERYDGSGYPYGLVGEEIPLSARIVSLADVYDALTSERPYKIAYSHEKALSIILRGDYRTKPAHFCPIVLQAFISISKNFKDFIQIP